MFHSKVIKLPCAMLAVFFAILLLFSSCGEKKYKFIDDGVLQAPDGTIYRRYENAVYFCSKITLGEFLGKVKGYWGTSDISDWGTDNKNHKKGVYSVNSDGSDDYIVFVEEELVDHYKSGEPQRSIWPIYVKDGCELSFRDWDKVVEVTLTYASPDTPIQENGWRPRTTYYLKDEYKPSEAMNALVGEEYVSNHKFDISAYFGNIHYRIDGIDLIDISCQTEYSIRHRWLMTSTDFYEYHINSEAFGMFEMPESMLDYMYCPFSDEEMEMYLQQQEEMDEYIQKQEEMGNIIPSVEKD